MRNSFDSMNRSEFAIYIPAYNAAGVIASVFDRIPSQYKDSNAEILVVNDGSTDDTARVVQEYSEKNPSLKLTLIHHPQNLGYGATQKTAYRWCIDHQVDVVAMLHADGQYAPELLPQLFDPILKGEAEMVFGSRIAGNPLKGGMPLQRYLGNRFLTTFQNLFLGMNLSEYHSGYRVFSVKALQKVPFHRLSSDFHFDTEMIILFKKYGLRIAETPIPTYYGSEPNFLNVWTYSRDIIATTLSFWLHEAGLRKSKNWGRIFKE